MEAPFNVFGDKDPPIPPTTVAAGDEKPEATQPTNEAPSPKASRPPSPTDDSEDSDDPDYGDNKDHARDD
eukprot:7830725-Heterocapsa_arctica.AAC.1